MLVLDQHVAVITQPRQGEMHRPIQRFLIIERRGEQHADGGQEREAIARGHGVRERTALTREELFPQATGVR